MPWNHRSHELNGYFLLQMPFLDHRRASGEDLRLFGIACDGGFEAFHIAPSSTVRDLSYAQAVQGYAGNKNRCE